MDTTGSEKHEFQMNIMLQIGRCNSWHKSNNGLLLTNTDFCTVLTRFRGYCEYPWYSQLRQVRQTQITFRRQNWAYFLVSWSLAWI